MIESIIKRGGEMIKAVRVGAANGVVERELLNGDDLWKPFLPRHADYLHRGNPRMKIYFTNPKGVMSKHTSLKACS